MKVKKERSKCEGKPKNEKKKVLKKISKKNENEGSNREYVEKKKTK